MSAKIGSNPFSNSLGNEILSLRTTSDGNISCDHCTGICLALSKRPSLWVFFHRIVNEKINQNYRCLLFYELLPYILKKLENTKGVISSRYLKKDRQYNGQRKKTKKQTNGLQNNTHKTKDRATRTPHKDGMDSSAPEG